MQVQVTPPFFIHVLLSILGQFHSAISAVISTVSDADGDEAFLVPPAKITQSTESTVNIKQHRGRGR